MVTTAKDKALYPKTQAPSPPVSTLRPQIRPSIAPNPSSLLCNEYDDTPLPPGGVGGREIMQEGGQHKGCTERPYVTGVQVPAAGVTPLALIVGLLWPQECRFVCLTLSL